MSEYKEFPDNSKVWVYQSNQFFEADEVDYISVKIDDFIDSWESHGNLVKATFEIVYDLFVVIFVDEQGDRMCGTAQDNSIKLIKELEQELEISLMDRMVQAYQKDDKVNIVKLSDFSKLIEDKEIDENTLVYNNTITTKYDFDNNWEVPLKESWHAQLV